MIGLSQKIAAGVTIVVALTVGVAAQLHQNPVVIQPPSYGIGVLPNPIKTPGAINPDVTPTTVSKTIAVSGWTSTIRPPASYTDKLKVQQLRDGYAVNGDMKLSDYEEDHLISLEVGGSPTDAKNLWPSLWHNNSGGFDLGMKTKDRVENAAAAIVKKDPSRLSEMQQGLAKDWPALYTKIVGPWPKWSGK